MAGAITNARILTPDEVIDPGTVLLDDAGLIGGVGRELQPPPAANMVDARGLTLVPGYIDLHVHGGGGYSLATRDPDEIRTYARWVISHGVTSFLPTVFGATVDEGLEFVRTAAQATGPVDGGARVLGVNLEGPFVNDRRRGALPKDWLRGEETALLKLLIEEARETLRIMTLAPEITDYRRLIETLTTAGVVASVGHTNVDYQIAQFAFAAGASHVTHLFNAMRPFHHREPGVVGAAFDDGDATVEVIADGVHLNPTVVTMLIKLFGPERIALVSDAVPPAGSPFGMFRLGEEEAEVFGDRVLLQDGTIAGSAETMDHCVRNIVWWQAADLQNAVRMASTVPAGVLGLSKRKGRIAQGYDADLVALDGDLDVVMTWVAGRAVYVRR